MSVTGDTTVIAVEPRPSSLDRLRRILTERLSHHLGTERLQMFLVAVSEAVTNAIEAHRRRQIDAAVTVTIDRPRGLLTVEDQGGGMDPGGSASLDPRGAPPSPDQQRGRGLLIMRSICPDLHIARSRTGLRVTLPIRATIDP